MDHQLPPRQMALLKFLREYIEENNAAPTYREIADHLDLTDIKNIHEQIARLEKKGFLTRDPGRGRSIRLLPTEDIGKVPLIGKVAAGHPLDIVADVYRMVEIPEGLFKTRPDFLMEATGDSMVDIGVLNGDLVGVKRVREPQVGQIVVVTVDTAEMSRAERKECGLDTSGVTIKRLAAKGSRKVVLKSENREKNYAPIVLRPDRALIEGRFVGLLRQA